MTGHEIALDQVGQDATRIRARGHEYDAALQRLRERGDGVSSWGDVSLISAFAGTYAECSQVAIAAYTGLSKVIVETGDGLDATVETVRDGQAASIERFGRI